jgi:hypothetical protein
MRAGRSFRTRESKSSHKLPASPGGTQTGPSGVYSIPGLPVGTYNLKISCEGFGPFKVKGIQLFVGQTRTMDAKLQVGALATQVEVQAEAAALETSDAQVGNVIENRQLSDIPVNGRNWATLQMLAPGAINVGGGDQHSIRFNGRGLDDNNYTFDGIDATGVQEQAQADRRGAARSTRFRKAEQTLFTAAFSSTCATTYSTRGRHSIRRRSLPSA